MDNEVGHFGPEMPPIEAERSDVDAPARRVLQGRNQLEPYLVVEPIAAQNQHSCEGGEQQERRESDREPGNPPAPGHFRASWRTMICARRRVLLSHASSCRSERSASSFF